MALFHLSVTQTKRSAGQSAIASAAYRAGERLYSEYYGEYSDYTRKGGVICSDILLPSHAPPEYADRQTLWNAVEKAERGKNAQLAYSFDIALQNEFSLEENIALARQFLLENFVSRGMVVDFAVHQPDREDGGIPNPHFHVLCPIRPIEQNGKWGLGGYIHAAIITIVMLCIDWRIGLTILCGILLFTWCIGRLQKKSETVSPQRQQAQEALVSNVLEYVQGMLIVKSFNLGQNSNSKMRQAILDSKDKNLKLERTFVPYNMLQQIILYGTSILVIVEGLYFYLNGTMALSICLLMTVASFMLFGQLQSAGNTSALLRLLDVSIDKVNEIDKTPVMDEHGKPVKSENYNIVFDDVSFSYGEHQVLDHVSLTIPERTVTAIVGPSGAGKSTLCNLIARFWDVDGGKITIGGVDVRDYTLDSLLTNISEVFQKVYLFADTIENNIKFGNPAASHEEVVKAAQKACCHEFIMSLPDGYGTVIGEGGATLSGGEKQRISIARAILKDAPIIILDEATSSVDPENENLLMGAIAELTKNKTVIMIAHRLKTVRNADQIFVLSGGHIVQTGKHEDLIRQPGIYADFIGIRKKAIGWKLK